MEIKNLSTAELKTLQNVINTELKRRETEKSTTVWSEGFAVKEEKKVVGSPFYFG